jgi:hypothetical protein
VRGNSYCCSEDVRLLLVANLRCTPSGAAASPDHPPGVRPIHSRYVIAIMKGRTLLSLLLKDFYNDMIHLQRNPLLLPRPIVVEFKDIGATGQSTEAKYLEFDSAE